MFTLKNISTLGRIVYPSLLWNVNTIKKELYLSFDDGPIPEVTPWVLSILKDFNAQATFFCIGDNIRKHPHIYEQILTQGHTTGNHTFNHINGWKTSTEDYLYNVLLAETEILKYEHENILKGNKGMGKRSLEAEDLTSSQSIISSIKSKDLKAASFLFRNSVSPTKKYLTTHNRYFRPPYGRLSPSQIRNLQQKGYKIVMWDVLSQDYDLNITAEKVFQNVIDMAKEGSVVVFHDSMKAMANLKIVLPGVLKYYTEKGFKFKAL